MGIEVLLGRTVKSINNNGDSISIEMTDGSKYSLHHIQDCCESVHVEDVIGDLNDLVGYPLTMAEEVKNADDPDSRVFHESHTWTFYKFATVRGYVTIRFLGESNGYYSEEVDFYEVK